jgi:hypothetical protein
MANHKDLFDNKGKDTGGAQKRLDDTFLSGVAKFQELISTKDANMNCWQLLFGFAHIHLHTPSSHNDDIQGEDDGDGCLDNMY